MEISAKNIVLNGFNVIYLKTNSTRDGDVMDDFEKIIEMAKQNNSIVRTKMVVEAGIRKERLKELLNKGSLVKISRGIYAINNDALDEYFEFQQKCPVGIYSYGTALYFWDLSNRVPNVISYTVPQGFNTSRIKAGSKVHYHYVKQEVLNVGAVRIKSPQGAEIMVYDRERTICDIVKDRKKMDMQIYADALNGYFKGSQKNMRRLVKYGKLFNIEEEIMKYMEVLQ